MNPIVILRDLLQRLPDRVRKGLYATVAGLGALVVLCDQFGVTQVGPIDVAQLEAALLVLAPIFGVTAAANVSRAAATKRPGRAVAELVVATKAVPFVAHLRCPMCPTTLSVPFTSAESWGRVDASDLGIAQLTITDGGTTQRHMQEHMRDDPDLWRTTLESQYRGEQQRATSYFDSRG